ncbi:unnamed protein product, partial [Iphiclides podalirius]
MVAIMVEEGREREIHYACTKDIRKTLETWKIRKNQEIEDMVSEPNIMGETKTARLRWLGQLERMMKQGSEESLWWTTWRPTAGWAAKTPLEG